MEAKSTGARLPEEGAGDSQKPYIGSERQSVLAGILLRFSQAPHLGESPALYDRVGDSILRGVAELSPRLRRGAEVIDAARICESGRQARMPIQQRGDFADGHRYITGNRERQRSRCEPPLKVKGISPLHILLISFEMPSCTSPLPTTVPGKIVTTGNPSAAR